MIWHFLEVWSLLVVALAAGCALGAYLYGVIAESRLATAQGVVADEIGDVLDQIKARLGLGPVWRPDHLRSVERPLPPVNDLDDVEEHHAEAEPVRAPNPPPLRREELRVAVREVRRALSAERVPLRAPVDEPPFVVGDQQRLASAMAVGADGVVPMRPAGLSAPRGGVPDNLTRIRGIGVRNEELLNSLGVYHFGQIAAWTPGEMRWIGQYLAFPERIERDDWVGQAMVLASGSETGFEKSAERRRQRRRQQQQKFMAQEVAAGVAGVLEAGKTPGDGRAEADEPDEAGEDDEEPPFADKERDDEP